MDHVAPGAKAVVEQLDAAGDLGLPLEVALPLEDAEVVVDHGGRAYLASRLYVPHRGREVVLVQEFPDKL